MASISRWLIVPIKKRYKIKSDPQRHKVYALERMMIGQSVNTRCTRDHLRSILAHACRKEKVPVPPLKFVHKPDEKIFGWTIAPPLEIILNSGFHGCNTFTLLHELSHYIADMRYEGHHDHGPEFVKVYMRLLDRYRIIPAYAFKVMLEKHGIEY